MRFWLIFLIFLGSAPVFAQTEKEETKSGAVVFFLDRPRQEFFELAPGETLQFCVQLPKDAPKGIRTFSERWTGLHLRLEDNSAPPRVLELSGETRKGFLDADAQGYYCGQTRIPAQASPGRYQVADLLFKANTGSYFSLRELLYGFSRAEEIEIVSPAPKEAPELGAIVNYSVAMRQKLRDSVTFRVRIKQMFRFLPGRIAIEPNSFRAHYQLWEDDQLLGRYTGRCRGRALKQSEFSCLLDLRQPKEFWRFVSVRVLLESLEFRDVSGRFHRLTTAQLQEKAAIEFDFPARR